MTSLLSTHVVASTQAPSYLPVSREGIYNRTNAQPGAAAAAAASSALPAMPHFHLMPSLKSDQIVLSISDIQAIIAVNQKNYEECSTELSTKRTLYLSLQQQSEPQLANVNELQLRVKALENTCQRLKKFLQEASVVYDQLIKDQSKAQGIISDSASHIMGLSALELDAVSQKTDAACKELVKISTNLFLANTKKEKLESQLALSQRELGQCSQQLQELNSMDLGARTLTVGNQLLELQTKQTALAVKLNQLSSLQKSTEGGQAVAAVVLNKSNLGPTNSLSSSLLHLDELPAAALLPQLNRSHRPSMLASPSAQASLPMDEYLTDSDD